MANVSRLDSSETTMEMIEIVPRTNSCSFATGRDDSAIFMIIYNHMMKLDILLFSTENDEFHFKFKTTENYFTNTLTIRLKWNRGFMLEARPIKVI